MSTPQTDLVIPVHGALDYVRNCIDTIFAHTKDFRLILVDDYSDVETTSYLMSVLQRQPVALYIRTGQQKWWSRASNIGLRLVRTNRAVLINSDCEVNNGWLEELFEVWEQAEQAGLRVGLVGDTHSDPEPRRWADIREPGYVTGHCWLVSMAALSQIADIRGQSGWYIDEVNPGAAHIHSDKFACWEMNKMGWATIAAMKAAVGHHGGRSWGHDLGKLYGIRIGDPLKGEIFKS